MQRVKQSILDQAIVEAKIIPYGVDLTVFHPENRQAVRSVLGIQQETKVLLFSANGIRKNIWKDYETLRTAVALVGERLPDQSVLCIALGEESPPERIGRAEIRFLPFETDPHIVARYYQAADVYLHAARADTFPNTVLEALACGTPVVATAVGGIPEQVRSVERVGNIGDHAYGLDEATGELVPPEDANAMAFAIQRLLVNSSVRERLGENAARDARDRFDLERQVDEHLEWYREIRA
jgi:glycosyltransferase involved in cell wall biosynthesis